MACGERNGVRGEYIGTPDALNARPSEVVGGVVERGGIGPEVNAPDGPKWTARSGALGGVERGWGERCITSTADGLLRDGGHLISADTKVASRVSFLVSWVPASLSHP